MTSSDVANLNDMGLYKVLYFNYTSLHPGSRGGLDTTGLEVLGGGPGFRVEHSACFATVLEEGTAVLALSPIDGPVPIPFEFRRLLRVRVMAHRRVLRAVPRQEPKRESSLGFRRSRYSHRYAQKACQSSEEAKHALTALAGKGLPTPPSVLPHPMLSASGFRFQVNRHGHAVSQASYGRWSWPGRRGVGYGAGRRQVPNSERWASAFIPGSSALTVIGSLPSATSIGGRRIPCCDAANTESPKNGPNRSSTSSRNRANPVPAPRLEGVRSIAFSLLSYGILAFDGGAPAGAPIIRAEKRMPRNRPAKSPGSKRTFLPTLGLFGYPS